MKIDSPRFGSLEVAPSKVIEFPAGLPGLEGCKQFTLIEVAEREHEIAVLQSIDDPAIALPVTTPDLLGLHYEFELSAEEEAALGKASPQDIAVMLVLRAGDASEPHGAARANLMAPLVINTATMRGLQKVIARLGCELTLKPV